MNILCIMSQPRIYSPIEMNILCNLSQLHIFCLICLSYVAVYIYSQIEMNILCIMSQLRIYSPIEQVKKSAIGETIFPPDKNFLIPQLREDRRTANTNMNTNTNTDTNANTKTSWIPLERYHGSNHRQQTVLTVPVNSNS